MVNKNNGMNESPSDGRGMKGIRERLNSLAEGRGLSGNVVKAGLAVILMVVVIYLIFFTVNYGKVEFYLSSKEIKDISSVSETQDSFKANEKIYYYIYRHSKSLDSTQLIVEVEYFETEYKHYKQQSNELDKDFAKLSGSIPEEYLLRSGKYRIKAYLDGKEVAKREITVSE
jgi:hypothetical protein